MRDNTLVHKLDEILRLVKLSQHPDKPKSQDGSGQPKGDADFSLVSTIGESNNKAKQRKTESGNHSPKWPVADRIQAGIGLLLIVTLGYSIRSFNLAVDTRDKQLRAYMTVSNIQLLQTQIVIPNTGAPIPTLYAGHNVFRFIEKNSGQTPAKDVEITLDPAPKLSGGGNYSTVADRSDPSSVVIGPGDNTFNDFGMTLSQNAIEDIGKNVAHLTYKGIITYHDIFGEMHHTRFCFTWVGHLQGMQACGDGNDFD